jgi:hypothetical protein
MGTGTLAALTTSILATPAIASDIHYFLRDGLDSQFMNLEVTDHDDDVKEKWLDESATAINMHLRGGVIVDETHRITLTVNSANDGELFKESYEDGSLKGELKQSEVIVSYAVHARQA